MKKLNYFALMLAVLFAPVPASFSQVPDTVVALQKADPGTGADEARPETPADSDNQPATGPFDRAPQSNNEVVSYGKNVHVRSNETAEAVVVFGGNARVDGTVKDAIVVIGGNIDLQGSADSAVAIFGNVNLLPGARAKEGVAIAGGVRVEKGAETHEAVAIGGKVDDSGGGKVFGEKVSLTIPGISAPEWLQAWFKECLLKMRPLAPSVGWVWIVAGVVLLFYLFVLLVFRSAVQACTDHVLNRPATTLLVGILCKILIPLLVLILIATGIGLLVVPFVLLGVFVLGVLGKVAILQAIGNGLGRATRAKALENPFIGFLIGAVVLVLLYMVPILGFIVYVLVGVWGMGAAVTAAAAALRREKPAATPPAGPKWPGAPVAAFTVPSKPGTAGASPASETSANFTEAQTTPQTESPGVASASASQTSAAPAAAPAGVLPPQIPITPSRYAGFWERMGAALLDIILISVVAGFAGGGKLWYLLALGYFSAMWTWRGTTIGGTVLGIKVTRVDGQPLSFAVALVRTLTAAFSAVVLFLGFFWIGWDPDKQGWHDKVAGTVVVKLPRTAPLVCM